MERRTPSFLVPSLIAAAGALVLINQWRYGRMLWLDEEMIAINIRERGFAELAGRLSLGQAAPYGWLVLERALVIAFGTGERVLRFVPLAFGLALLVTAVWIGRRWMTVAGAAALAFLCALGQWVWFHALELKHYSADACFGLLLPALAVRAIERDERDGTGRAVARWWMVAAAAQWFANGALFVAPACVVVIGVAQWRRTKVLRHRSEVHHFEFLRHSWIWLVSFAVNYLVTLGPVRANAFLVDYWKNAFPPADAGLLGSLQWTAAQLAPLAIKPGGSGFGLIFWIAVGAGFVVTRRYSTSFRLAFALVPLSGCAWAALRLVPMLERLSLWMVAPAYVGVALAVEAAVDAVAAPARALSWRKAAGVGAAVFFLLFFADVAQRGLTYMSLDDPAANHELDDRGAVRWLARQHRAGDAWVTTHNALPAIWWYAPDIASPVFEATVVDDSPTACGATELGRALQDVGASRALVYLGFGHEVSPTFDDTLVSRLGTLGRIVAYDQFSPTSHALVVDFRDRPSGPVTLAALGAPSDSTPTKVARGCVTVSAAARW